MWSWALYFSMAACLSEQIITIPPCQTCLTHTPKLLSGCKSPWPVKDMAFAPREIASLTFSLTFYNPIPMTGWVRKPYVNQALSATSQGNRCSSHSYLLVIGTTNPCTVWPGDLRGHSLTEWSTAGAVVLIERGDVIWLCYALFALDRLSSGVAIPRT